MPDRICDGIRPSAAWDGPAKRPPSRTPISDTQCSGPELVLSIGSVIFALRPFTEVIGAQGIPSAIVPATRRSKCLQQASS
jgi:hypothetical protein